MNSSSPDHSPTLENSMSSMTIHGPVQKAYASTTHDTPNYEPPSTRLPLDSPSALPRARTFSERAKALLNPEKPLSLAPTTTESLKAVLKASRLNILLPCIPVSWALHWALPESNGSKDTVVFVVSFLAIVPLANLLAFATEELGLRVGQTLAGLMNATLGNAVELIVAIIALVKCELRVVQASCATQLNSSLLAISVIAVLLPAAFHFAADANLDDATEARDILAVSHGVAIILLFIYAGYLFFQLYSHTALYQDQGEHVIASTRYTEPKFRFRRKPMPTKEHTQLSDVETAITTATQTTSRTATELHSTDTNGVIAVNGEDLEEEEKLQMNLTVTIGLLVSVTVLVAVTAEWLVGSIHGLTESGNISKEFVGIILLPIVGNAAEHMTAVSVSMKDKLNLSLGVAVGSSIQIALFVIPFVPSLNAVRLLAESSVRFIVVLAWILGKPLTLLFDPYESIALFLAVITVNYVVQDGKSNWLEGFILMCLYVILGVTFWFYPGSDPSNLLALCH
ncbi:hypothetical protein CVT24_009348 [Panaeolus cyanescens]|uniref:Sodium/calcium exchanger membrane region domain-containing protein n=1 Tax=Panaeolus cyanescens TaxID=181874 RepID=A0A409Y861_9AGAR|nr:hypothetical protein CVT24_009348 [Panaeolus cyanescens]